VLGVLWARHAGLTGAERAAIQDLAYGTCRWLGTLREVLRQALNKPLADADVEALLLVALYQLHWTRAPAHAVVVGRVRREVTRWGAGCPRFSASVCSRAPARIRAADSPRRRDSSASLRPTSGTRRLSHVRARARDRARVCRSQPASCASFARPRVDAREVAKLERALRRALSVASLSVASLRKKNFAAARCSDERRRVRVCARREARAARCRRPHARF
jgi:hypothetical protein